MEKGLLKKKNRRRRREMTGDYGCTYVKTKRPVMSIVSLDMSGQDRDGSRRGPNVFMRARSGAGEVRSIY